MSEPTSTRRSTEPRFASATTGGEALLPPECTVPGYWETLAENTSDWAPVVSASPMWRACRSALDSWKKEYRRHRGGVLLKDSSLPDFIGKSAQRIREKTTGRIARAANPDSESKKLFDQSVPVPRLEDLVRVRLQTQFLDGVPFLARKLQELALTYDNGATLEAKGKLSGYFAQHLTFKSPVHFRFNGVVTSCDVTCEVQIATSLATLVWENSHDLYEVSRVTQEAPEEWQWNPNDPRFLSRQLGHMIHLADGLFCNLRDKANK